MNSNFNLNLIKDLSPNEAKKYVTKFFVPLDNGNHAMLIDGVYHIKEDQEVKKAYFNRMQKELGAYYFTTFCEVKSVVYQINKDTFFDDKINLCPPMKFKVSKNYIEPNRRVMSKLEYVLGYMKDILCSGDEDCYNFLLKWVSNVCKGNKNNSCLYLKGMQGIGKSTLFYFLSNHVIGNKLCLETGSDPIRTKFNEILGGKLLVCIEELENFSKGEWESISSTLKRMITSSNISLQNKCTKSYESNNINNYILCSNNDAIKDDDGRRYFILDMSTDRIGDREYFDKLYNGCFNDEVGEAFFNYMVNIDTNNFNPQSFPITQAKKDSIVKRLDSVYRFLKNEYILRKLDIDCTAQFLYDQYKFQNVYTGGHKVSREDFHKRLLEVGIKKRIVNKKLHYEVPYDVLKSIGDSKRWIHELDEFEEYAEEIEDPFILEEEE